MGNNAYDHRSEHMFDANAHIAKLQAEEKAKREAEEKYATNHSFGLLGRPIKVIRRTVIPMVKSRKTGEVLSKRNPKITYRYVDNEVHLKINDFWEKLGLIKSDKNSGAFVNRITGYKGRMMNLVDALKQSISDKDPTYDWDK